MLEQRRLIQTTHNGLIAATQRCVQLPQTLALGIRGHARLFGFSELALCLGQPTQHTVVHARRDRDGIAQLALADAGDLCMHLVQRTAQRQSQGLVAAPQRQQQACPHQDKQQAQQSGGGPGVAHHPLGTLVNLLHHRVDGAHDVGFELVVLRVMQHPAGPAALGLQVRSGRFDQRHGGEFHRRQPVRTRLGLLQLAQFVGCKSSLLHQFQQCHRSAAGGLRGRDIHVRRLPIRITGMDGARPAPFTDIQNVQVMLFVNRVACQHIGTHHTGQIGGRLAQGVGQHVGLKAPLVGQVHLLFGVNIGRKHGNQDTGQGHRQPQAARKP